MHLKRKHYKSTILQHKIKKFLKTYTFTAFKIIQGTNRHLDQHLWKAANPHLFQYFHSLSAIGKKFTGKNSSSHLLLNLPYLVR